jgi:hypothetical protein
MDRKKLLSWLIGIIFIIGLLCISCNNGTNDNENNNCNNNNDNSNNNNNENPGGVNLTGTYGRYMVSQATYNDRIIFTSTSFSSTNRTGSFLSGTYKYDGAILTLTISGIKHNKYANLSGTTLTISGDGGYSEFFNGTWTPR